MKARKGVMPLALKKYWASRRKKTASGAKFNRSEYHRAKRASRTRKYKKFDAATYRTSALYRKRKAILDKRRATNPKRGYVLLVRKGNTELRDIGGQFSTSGAPVIYPTSESVLRAAKAFKRKFSVLKGFGFYCRPV